MLPTQKNNGYVKGISVFNGKNSCVWTNKEEKDIPTAENESIMITAVFGDMQGRYVMVVDVPSACM